jgi:hypothetical protein
VAGKTRRHDGSDAFFQQLGISMRLKRGQYVRHSKHGWGTIVECNDRQTLVYFRTVGIKKLATASAMFAMVGGEAFNKKAARIPRTISPLSAPRPRASPR